MISQIGQSTISIPLFLPDVKPGTRVGCFSSFAKDEEFNNALTLRLFGYGVYEGCFFFGDEESKESFDTITSHVMAIAQHKKHPIPRIRLDDGTVVWGVLVYWDTEDEVVDMAKEATFVVGEDYEEYEARMESSSTLSFLREVPQVNVFNKSAIPVGVN